MLCGQKQRYGLSYPAGMASYGRHSGQSPPAHALKEAAGHFEKAQLQGAGYTQVRAESLSDGNQFVFGEGEERSELATESVFGKVLAPRY